MLTLSQYLKIFIYVLIIVLLILLSLFIVNICHSNEKYAIKICFVTCLMSTTGKDSGLGNLNFRKPKLKNKFGGHDFILFTNHKNTEEIKKMSAWEPIYISNKELDKLCNLENIPDSDNQIRKDVYRSRYHKFQGYKYLENVMNKKYDVIFYCDVDKVPNSDYNWQELASDVITTGLVQRRHPVRILGVYDECKRIARSGRDTVHNMNKSLTFFKNNNTPTKLTTTENNFFGYCPSNKKITDLMDYFFELYITEKLSHRDQPLWWFALWKKGITPTFRKLI